MMDETEISFVEEEHATEVEYPAKYEKAENEDGMVENLPRSVMSLVLYLGLGYLFFQRWDVLLIITAVVALHEMGHFVAMKYYNYGDTGIFFIPFLGAFVSGRKREVSQMQNAIILLAGPVPGIVLGIILHFVDQAQPGIIVGDVPLHYIVMLLVWLNVINLLPVYPLDGGQLLNRVYLDEEGWLSNLFIFLSAALLIWIAVSTKFYVLLILPAMFILRYVSTFRHLNLEKKIAEQGIDLDTSYEELSDENYWKIRSIIVKNVPAFYGVKAGPPYKFDAKEDKIVNEVENVLQRNLLFDVNTPEKIVILLIWAVAIASPWIFKIGVSLLNYVIDTRIHL